MRTVWILAGLLLGLSTAATAQTEYMDPGTRRAESRRALRDARKYQAEYKDSHLAVRKEALQAGRPGRAQQPNDGRQSYKFDNAGMPRVSEPAHAGLGLRKKNKAKKD